MLQLQRNDCALYVIIIVVKNLHNEILELIVVKAPAPRS